MGIQDYTIEGSAFYLKDVFSPKFQYSIPDYQRPYSWEEEHIKQLFIDLYEFYQRNKEEEVYFLGSIVVIKRNHDPKTDVVDGQQRLTSLTILFSVLANFIEDKYKSAFVKYIQQQEDIAEKIPAQPRLILRPRDKDFFKKYIQELNIDKLRSLNVENDCKNDAQKNIYKNTISILDCVKEVFNNNSSKILDFFSFIVNKCCIVIVSTPSQKSAFRIFSVLNNRGLDLLPTDILKAAMIGEIKAEQDKYTKKWEDMEQDLGRSHFNDLFTHLRMIKLKAKARKSVLEEIQELILPQITSIPDFIDNELESYANIFWSIKNGYYKIGVYQEEVNKYLKWLNQINFSEWVPVAILFLHQKPDAQQTFDFFKQLEILTAYLHLSAQDVNKRIKRYSSILEELQNKPKQIISSLMLTSEEKQYFRKLLNGNIYTEMNSVRRNYLILRTDEVISANDAEYKNKLLTIEHVLPQTINEDSQWRTWWSDEEQEHWLHRLANLIPLNKRRNSAALNWDFNKKKNKYFPDNGGVSSYALTTQVLSKEEWTPAIVEARQEYLLNKLYETWDLSE